MGKIRVRKKLRKKIKDNSTLISYGLIALSVLFIFFMFLIFTGNDNSVFKVEDRTKEVKDSLKNDTDDFKTIGWVKVQGTNIDYPVLKFVSTQYEMPVNDFSYAWTVNDGIKLDKRIDIAGHNILNLSRNPVKQDDMFYYFEELLNFVYIDFAKENQFIQFHLNGKEYVYQIFSVNFLKPFDVNYYATNGMGEDEIKEYLETLKKGNLYDHDIDVNEDDKFITLYTCTRFFDTSIRSNFVVTARLLRDGEKPKLAKITKTEKYDEILELMKGGEEDEEV